MNGDYKAAWDAAIGEYNNYGLALHNHQHRIDTATSLLMYGFKVDAWHACPGLC